MSFRLFVYYCAVVGAWSGFIGWALGIVLSPSAGNNFFWNILRTSMVAMFLGVSVAFALSFLDAAFNLSLRRFGTIFLRVFAATVLGLLGGLVAGSVGGSLYYLTSQIIVVREVSFLIGWLIVGFLIGVSIGFFELVVSMITKQDVGSAVKKVIKCVAGGTLGGLIGGVFALVLRLIVEWLINSGLLANRSVEDFWCPVAGGFIAIGASIGLLVGLAQIILKEAWIKVEAGFRPGREMFLTKTKTSIGRAEGSDIALFGDSSVEKNHANIVKENGRYYLEDLQTPGGTYVNDQKVEGKAPLKAGDLIRIGKSLLRFNERAKRKD